MHLERVPPAAVVLVATIGGLWPAAQQPSPPPARGPAGALLVAAQELRVTAPPPAAAAARWYSERIPGSTVTFEMVAVPGGSISPGSPLTEPGRADDEGPRRRVEVAPFWIGRHEVTWDEFRVFMYATDLESTADTLEPLPAGVDAVSRPTRPYVPMDFGMGVEGFPAVGMTHFAARQYTRWLSAVTGRFHRLPSEAEWEHACRASTATAYSFGDDPAALPDHAWFFANSPDGYQRVGTRTPNPWGLYDLHGNVAEWVLDQYVDRYPANDPMVWPTTLYPHVVRGGSFLDDPPDLRCAARRASSAAWKRRDPQLPQSIWYLTDARFVGFRVVRPLDEPSRQEQERWWGPDTEEEREILRQQSHDR